MVRGKALLPLLLTAILLITGIAVAQTFQAKIAVPNEAVQCVEKYIATLGKTRIEHIDRLGNTTFLFVVRVISEDVGGENIHHYIITTKYLEYRIIYDSTEIRYAA